MLGSFRPPKRTLSYRQPKRTLNGYYSETKLENVIASLEIPLADIAIRRCASERSRRKNLAHNNNAPAPGAKFLHLNIGGASYILKHETILKGCADSLLCKFVQMPHEERLQNCDNFFPETGEFFFERSAVLFDPIYQYYVSGECHKPKGICLDLFLSELVFWHINEAIFSGCCWPQKKKSEDGTPKEDGFDNVCLGGVRRKVWNLVEVPESSFAARVFACLSVVAVLMSIGNLVLSSVPDFQVARNVTQSGEIFELAEPHPVLRNFEYVCMGWFTSEYLAKMLVAANRRHTFLQILNIIDLVAIAPFYFELSLQLTGVDTGSLERLNGALLMIRILRVSRVIRIFKLGRYSSGLRAFARTLKASTKQLSMLTVVLMTGVMFFSTLVFSLEKDVVGTKFTSIPAAFWWCIVTMTTVGYGDMTPQTTAGKLVGSGAIACGVLVLALPITIIVDNFMKVHESDEELPPNHPYMRRKNELDNPIP